jgi:hypothetical protein
VKSTEAGHDNDHEVIPDHVATHHGVTESGESFIASNNQAHGIGTYGLQRPNNLCRNFLIRRASGIPPSYGTFHCVSRRSSERDHDFLLGIAKTETRSSEFKRSITSKPHQI